jgi:hypothetical protein
MITFFAAQKRSTQSVNSAKSLSVSAAQLLKSSKIGSVKVVLSVVKYANKRSQTPNPALRKCVRHAKTREDAPHA